jgi:glutamyl/glutaminyl-tRNA synthetase
MAQQRALDHHGILVLRNEDLDRSRCRPAFVESMIEDLRWFGLDWQEGPDRGGPFAPYSQSQRLSGYREAFAVLLQNGLVYPCVCSRQDIARALSAPHAADDEILYPGTCRNRAAAELTPASSNWRFRVPDGEAIRFVDAVHGPQEFIAGRDFGDFVVWRRDDLPSYQLAVVVDDAAMGITEVVRGADLLLSTARQLLVYRALHLSPPGFCHCPLLNDARGVRLAKRHDALSLRRLRAEGKTPQGLRDAVRLHRPL